MKKYHFVTGSSFENMEELSGIFEEAAESVCLFENEEKWFFEAIFHEEDIAIIQNLAKNAEMEIMIEELPDVDWLKKVYDDFPPLEIGKFYIYGSHIKEKPPSKLIPLLVDAATAFGSGHHESTFGCLTAFSELKDVYQFSSALDMGCGSGILALGIASLWDCPVIGVDNDPEAVRVTIENAKLNGKENLKAFVNEGFSGELFKQFSRFDLIAANILAGPLMDMAPSLANELNPNGIVVLAGLLTSQVEEIQKVYESVNIYVIKKIPVGVWSTLVLQKR